MSGLPTCPVCSAQAWRPAMPGTTFRPCAKCGTVLNDRSASREEEERRYEDGSAPYAPDDAATLATARARWDWLKRRTGGTAPASLLDVGCGRGAFLACAQADGSRAAGLELDPRGVAACVARGLEVTGGSVLDAALPAGPWQVITLWDVLDHLEDPGAALTRLVRLLAPGGLLVVRGRNASIHVPVFTAYPRVSGLAGRLGIPRDMAIIHRWGFRPSGFRQLLRGAGLDEVGTYPGFPSAENEGEKGFQFVKSAAKGVVKTASSAAFHASFGRLYPFPSVLVSGRKP